MANKAVDIRREALAIAAQRLAETDVGPHIAGDVLERYVAGALGDVGEVTTIRRHLARCNVCLRKELRLETGRVLAFEPRRLKVLGWEMAAAQLAAGHEASATYESLSDGEARMDLQVSSADEVFVTAIERQEPLIGWMVRLERVDVDGAVISDERSETTDVRGRASLGSLRTLQPLKVGQRFRVVAVAPWE
jgi:hypothetical protein